MEITMDLLAAFQGRFGAPPAVLSHAPGRVNLLGEHVDYNMGPVLPAAIDRAVHIAAAPSEDGNNYLAALDLDEEAVFNLEGLDRKASLDGTPLPGWALYPAGVAWSLKNAGFHVPGVRAAFTSTIPIGAGLSSSAALEVSFAVLWQALGEWQADRMIVARLCQRAENQYVGVASGLMDQFASAHGVAGHALYFDTRSLEWEPYPLIPGTALVIADSGVRHTLASSEYNDRRSACEQAVETLKKFLPDIESLRDVSTTEFAAYSTELEPAIRKRAEHVVKEIARVESAVSALRREDAQAFGALMYSGHASLRNLYEVSTPELDRLVEIARHLPGSIGARLTGAGFGGCTINLVEAGQAETFVEGLKAGYREATGIEAQIYLCHASDGAYVEPYHTEKETSDGRTRPS